VAGPPAHETTTRHLAAAYPFAAEPGLGRRGVLVGRDLLGSTFSYDPFDLYRRGLITNPNMVVLGQIGRGKSAFVKTYLWRQAAFGRRAWVIDPKGEYGPLARAWGVEPVALRPGGSVRLNPLDALSPGQRTLGAADHDESTRRRAELLSALASASLGRGLLPTERSALDLAVAEVSVDTDAARAGGRRASPTLPAVVGALLAPSADAARAVGTDVAGLAADGRHVALELRRLVAGDLRGMFDGSISQPRILAAVSETADHHRGRQASPTVSDCERSTNPAAAPILMRQLLRAPQEVNVTEPRRVQHS